MKLEQIAKSAGKEVEASLLAARASISRALEDLRPLKGSPLLWNGVATAVRELYDELDGLEDRIPEIQGLVREHFGISSWSDDLPELGAKE